MVGTGVDVARSVMTRVSVSRNPSNSMATLRNVRALTSPMTTKSGLSIRRHSAATGGAAPTPSTKIARASARRVDIDLLRGSGGVEGSVGHDPGPVKFVRITDSSVSGRSWSALFGTALAATFVDVPNDKTGGSVQKGFVSFPLPGALLAR
jgi:hypothetical protein